MRSPCAARPAASISALTSTDGVAGPSCSRRSTSSVSSRLRLATRPISSYASASSPVASSGTRGFLPRPAALSASTSGESEIAGPFWGTWLAM